jgi:hypothetical protein
MKAAALVGATLFALAACGGSAGAPPAWLASSGSGEATHKDIASGSALERFFPLVDGMIYQYVTENELGEPGLLIARVARSEEKSGELRFPTGVKRFSFAPEGVFVEAAGGPVYLLKAPLVAGSSFRGEHGGLTRIQSTSAAVDVPAGHFDGCIQTLEERSGDRPVRYATTFCPAVGVVLLEVASGASLERAALKSYAEPVQMKPDGLERFQVTPPPDAPAPPLR